MQTCNRVLSCYDEIYEMGNNRLPKTQINKNNNNGIIETPMVKTDVFVVTQEKFYKIYIFQQTFNNVYY